MSEIEAKVRYVKLARSLKTYGVSFFLVKVEQQPPCPTSDSPKFCFFSIHLFHLQLLPLNLCCSSLFCIFLLHFPEHCLPTPWFMLFLIVKLHVVIITTRKYGLVGVLVAMADLRYLCLSRSVLGVAHRPSVMAYRRR